MTINGKIISFINMKGGVGKTTLTINVAKELSKQFNVLVIDMDPQFNATQSLLIHKLHENPEAFKEEFLVQTTSEQGVGVDEVSPSEQEDIEESIKIQEEIRTANFYEKLSDNNQTALQIFEKTTLVEGLANPSLVIEIAQNLSLIPGDLKLSKKISGDTSSLVSVIMKHIKHHGLINKFHYILIDCPPTWSILTHASLVASDAYVIPSKVDLYSSIGIQLLEEQIKEKLLEDEMYVMSKKTLHRLGVIFTLVHSKIKAEEDRINYLKGKFEEVHFFDSRLPHLPSVPNRFILFADGEHNAKYAELTNAIEKICYDITERLEGVQV